MESITTSLPTKIQNNKLIVEVAHKEDVNVFNNAKSYLNNKLNDTYKAKLSIEFIEGNFLEGNTELAEQTNESSKQDESFNNHPVVKAIVTELGGREIK